MKELTTVLVVDDEPDIRELITLTLDRMDIAVETAAGLAQAKALLAQHQFQLCLADMKLPDGDGLDLVTHIQKTLPYLPVAVITAHGTMDTAVRALKNGAFDFVAKPIDLHQLRNLVNAALLLRKTASQATRKNAAVLLGESDVIHEIRNKIGKLARSQAPVCISGESGTGKELVAKLIHSQSARADKPFVAVNCGAIPPELMESEFFGHKKGSFTGAAGDKIGLFQAAEGGTLFLDEVADLPLLLQVKLLRAIQEKAVRPVGAAKEIAVDVRILSASHKNLEQLVQQGQFRQDLYYRINVIQLRVPPLRERPGDIAVLARHILERLAESHGQVCALSPEADAALADYAFPGNVRELENVLERAVALCEDQTIRMDDLGLPECPTGSLCGGMAELETVATTQEAVPPLPADAPCAEWTGLGALENYKETLEKQTILRALEQTRWNRTAAAKQLGITFRALRYRLKKLGLE
ncbi:MAG: sigma-54-dependent Fis family transcriptional regulator [Methylococcaceae bacterium]|nr:MAG: sigma-54-dependent Fis family transcriptional regulator [Methylococcaceae bacterium]